MKHFYEHQKKMMRYAMEQQHPVLFVEMRLGKTLVALRRCASYTPRNERIGLRVLVAAPNSALGSWEREALEEGWSVVWLAGLSRRRRLEALEGSWRGCNLLELVLINREGWLSLPEISMHRWDAVIADESPFLKNPQAKVTKFFMRNFRTVPHRWILTGTPCPEGEHEYFCQLAFCRGGAFGFQSFWDFRQQYMEPNPHHGGWGMKPGAADHLRRVVGTSCCVMRRKDVGLEKKKIYERRTFQLPKDIRKLYDTVEDEWEIPHEGEDARTTKWVTTRWQWLRELCGGFLEKKLVWSGKIDELVGLLQGELKQEKVVVWCCYTQEIIAIEQRLRKARVAVASVTGRSTPEVRRAVEKSFGGSLIRVVLAQQALGQGGSDYSPADTVIYYSSPPGQLARQQTEDRIVTVAKKQPLLYIDLVVENSVDEDVLSALQKKVALSDLSLTRALNAAMRERKGWT